MGKNISKVFLLCIGLLLVAGCATTSREATVDSEEEELEVYAGPKLAVGGKLRFEDLPIPAGFKMLKDKSYVFQTEDTRVALLKYSGRAKLPELVDFFQQQMLLYNWELLNMVEYDKSVLNFQRGRQTCIITIESRGRKQLITISIAPKAKGSIEVQGQK